MRKKILIFGAPNTGKLTKAQGLCKHSNTLIINKIKDDAIRAVLDVCEHYEQGVVIISGHYRGSIENIDWDLLKRFDEIYYCYKEHSFSKCKRVEVKTLMKTSIVINAIEKAMEENLKELSKLKK